MCVCVCVIPLDLACFTLKLVTFLVEFSYGKVYTCHSKIMFKRMETNILCACKTWRSAKKCAAFILNPTIFLVRNVTGTELGFGREKPVLFSDIYWSDGPVLKFAINHEKEVK